MSIPNRLAVAVLGAILLTIPVVASGLRIGDCSGGRFAADITSAAGLPFEDGSSPRGSFTVADGMVTLGACPETPADFGIVRHRRFWRARWGRCAAFVNVHLRIEIGPGGGDCGYVVGVIRYRDASGRRRAIKFPAERTAP